MIDREKLRLGPIYTGHELYKNFLDHSSQTFTNWKYRQPYQVGTPYRTCRVHSEAVDGVLVAVEGRRGHGVVAGGQGRQSGHVPQEYCLEFNEKST